MAEAKRHHPNYIGIFIMLAVLTAAELGVAFVSAFSRNVLLLILIVLAVWKALLVALYFMHLRFETNRVRILAIAPLPLAVIMVVAVITEYVW
ncbi:MAG TPA: cytochrome C oxidase subunit IV family protein [Gemmatimonadales bacterium]